MHARGGVSHHFLYPTVVQDFPKPRAFARAQCPAMSRLKLPVYSGLYTEAARIY